jgi:replicative DNA helicase
MPRDTAAGAEPLPTNIEIEQHLLGAILVNNTAYRQVGGLKQEHFSNAGHGRLFAAMGALIGRGEVADPITLKNAFEHDEALKDVVGAGYLGHLATRAVTVSNAPHYARQIVDLARRRQLIAFAQNLHDDAHRVDLNRPASAINADALSALRAIEDAHRHAF